MPAFHTRRGSLSFFASEQGGEGAVVCGLWEKKAFPLQSKLGVSRQKPANLLVILFRLDAARAVHDTSTGPAYVRRCLENAGLQPHDGFQSVCVETKGDIRFASEYAGVRTWHIKQDSVKTVRRERR